MFIFQMKKIVSDVRRHKKPTFIEYDTMRYCAHNGPEDEDAKFNYRPKDLNFWKKISGLESSKIIEISSNDNFWSMGDVGPCGPCSEIFYDNGDKISGGLPGTKNQDGNRFVEIWNLVFMQHEKKEDKFIDLPIKCVDTGMGLERINAVINGKTNSLATRPFILFSATLG